MLTLRLARMKTAAALVAVLAASAFASPLAVAAGKCDSHRPIGAGGGKRVR